MDRIRIARSLLKIAKAIIVGYRQEHLADCIFDKGVRKNYCGNIDCGGSYGTLENADLEVVRCDRNNGYVVFRKGTWHGGTWRNGEWLGGEWDGEVWEDGDFKGGTWYGGTWHDGTFSNAEWMGGKFEKGTFRDSVWHNGTWTGRGTWGAGNVWEFGYDMLGDEHGKDDSPDKWKRTFDMVMWKKLIQLDRLVRNNDWDKAEIMLSEDPVFKKIARRIFMDSNERREFDDAFSPAANRMKSIARPAEPKKRVNWNGGLHELGRGEKGSEQDAGLGSDSQEERKRQLDEEKRQLVEKRRRDIAMRVLEEMGDLF